jgi:hypothetical protein
MKYIITIILLLFSKSSFSDWLDYYINMDCESEKSVATIVPSDVYNAEMNQRTAECNLKSGTKIKAKFGTGRVYPYGQGGADPDKWVSLWVNKAKVISRQRIGCFADGPCSMYFKASEKYLEICSIKRDYIDKYKAPIIPNDFVCQKVLYEYLNQGQDYIEYPIKESQYRLPGTVNIFYANNSTFCQKFIENGEYKLPSESVSLKDKQKTKSEYAGNIGRLSADFNNDGSTDEIYVLHSRTRYNDGDSYFIFDKNNQVSSKWPNIDVKDLDNSKKYVFPNQWARCNNKSGCKYDQFNYLKLLSPDPNSLKLPLLRPRYLRASPFTLNNTVYFHLSSMGAYDGHIASIMKPLADGNVEHMCYFNRVEENY